MKRLQCLNQILKIFLYNLCECNNSQKGFHNKCGEVSFIMHDCGQELFLRA